MDEEQMPPYDIGYNEIEDAVRQIGPKTILLQLPSGLKRRAGEIADELTKRFGCDVIISGDSCFGACDVPAVESVIADLVIQIGHSPMPNIEYPKPVLFVPARLPIDLPPAIDSAIPLLSSPVGLLATSQHIDLLEKARELLGDRGIETRIGAGSGRLFAPGHVLGCDYSSALSIAPSVSSFLMLGGGRFHAIGAKLVTKKPVIVIDPERSEAVEEDIDIDTVLRKRHVVIEKLADARSVAVIVSSKLGQRRLELAKELMRLLKEHARKASMVVIDDILPEKLDELGFNAYVSTACPRMAIEDAGRFDVVLGTPIELLIALEEIDWGEYRFDDWCFSCGSERRD